MSVQHPADIHIVVYSPLVISGLTNVINKFREFVINKIICTEHEFKEYILGQQVEPFLAIVDIDILLENQKHALFSFQKKWANIELLGISMKPDADYVWARHIDRLHVVSVNASINELHKTLIEIKEGNCYKLKHPGQVGLNKLTIKEKEFVSFICSNLTYKEIAQKMGISQRTVETHRDHLFAKFDINSRSALIMRAIELGLIQNTH